MQQAVSPEVQKPVLLVAAESIALASGMSETVADVLRAKALKHYGEGIRQYLAIRLKSTAAADKAVAELRTRLEDVSSEAFATPPGPRAHLYRMARHVIAEHRVRASTTAQDLAWLAPAKAPHSYVVALARLRRELAPEDAELLELRYARELTPDEVAFVVGRNVDDVITSLERAASRAAGIVGRTPPSRLGGLRGALQEAFALSPTPGGRSLRSEKGRLAIAPGTVIGERYAVRERVGEGSFGDVYRALDTDVPGHVVALKILHKAATNDETRKSALRELRLIASVFHPSVVDFKDHGWYQDRLWFVMPWYEGETLEERINRAPLTRHEARDIFEPLAQALATMHAAGIRHQDIKPDNIFLARIGDSKDGHRILPVLIDLGVAAKEAEMIVAGTPLYFPPEIAAQYAGKPERPPVTHKADVFSLALSLRNALEPSTQEEVPGTAVEAFISHRADFPPGPPSGRDLKFLEPCFQRWLARDATLRPTAQQFADELAVLTRPEQQRERRRTIMRWAAPLAMGSVVGLSSITYVYLQKRQEASAALLRAEVTESKLGKESQRRMQLEESYQHSELTRQQLAERLVEREHDVTRLGAQLSHAKRSSEELAGRLQSLASELEAVRRSEQAALRKAEAQGTRISVLEGELYSSEQRLAFVESELREARLRMNTAENELDNLRTRARSLLTELDRARSEAQTQFGRASSMEQALLAARAEKNRAQQELQAEREKNAELEREVRSATQRGASEGGVMP